jgi:hypothetical protein
MNVYPPRAGINKFVNDYSQNDRFIFHMLSLFKQIKHPRMTTLCQ